MNSRMDRFPSAALTACILGLVICPAPFIAIGARSGLPSAIGFVLLPAFVFGSAFLLVRFLGKTANRSPGAHAMRIAEAAAWVVIAAFLFFVSGVNLMTGVERSGAVSTFFLAASVCWLPVVAVRKTALEARLTQLPRRVAIVMLIVVVAVSGISMINFIVTPSAFI